MFNDNEATSVAVVARDDAGAEDAETVREFVGGGGVRPHGIGTATVSRNDGVALTADATRTSQ